MPSPAPSYALILILRTYTVAIVNTKSSCASLPVLTISCSTLSMSSPTSTLMRAIIATSSTGPSTNLSRIPHLYYPQHTSL